jgi:PIN domain nuclease of toxin-antitoxin system
LKLLLDAGVQPLPITLDHAAAVESLPWHHRDPFDDCSSPRRYLRKPTSVSPDDRLSQYGVSLVW